MEKLKKTLMPQSLIDKLIAEGILEVTEEGVFFGDTPVYIGSDDLTIEQDEEESDMIEDLDEGLGLSGSFFSYENEESEDEN